ncbi:MAG TPA: P-II family nitrogen regulator [Tepidisphaeraceae bacterium]|jgi:nitrogen regulatory protein PII|nr:P-II family nitrogen regulator [Tepidisphaeraceae bacterium]
MQMIVAVVKPNRVASVKAALLSLGILGMTAIESKGYAKQLGHNERYRGPKMDAGFIPKVCLFVCVKDAEKDAAMEAVVQSARTGGVGDGKIFVLPASEVLRIRTGERDEAAL